MIKEHYLKILPSNNYGVKNTFQKHLKKNDKNNVNTMEFSSDYLSKLKNDIEKLTKQQQMDILWILKQNPSVKLNENKSGIFVNISFLPKNVVLEIEKYMKCVEDQEVELKKLENQKQEFQNTFFSGVAFS